MAELISNPYINRLPADNNAATVNSQDFTFGLLLGEVDADGIDINFTEQFENVEFGIKRFRNQAVVNYKTDSLTGHVVQQTVTVDDIEYLHVSVTISLEELPPLEVGFCEFLAVYPNGFRRSLNLAQYTNNFAVLTPQE